jgi:hypothetical protein
MLESLLGVLKTVDRQDCRLQKMWFCYTEGSFPPVMVKPIKASAEPAWQISGFFIKWIFFARLIPNIPNTATGHSLSKKWDEVFYAIF